eukprot:3066528-Amphidinium_carterae.1
MKLEACLEDRTAFDQLVTQLREHWFQQQKLTMSLNKSCIGFWCASDTLGLQPPRTDLVRPSCRWNTMQCASFIESLRTPPNPHTQL